MAFCLFRFNAKLGLTIFPRIFESTSRSSEQKSAHPCLSNKVEPIENGVFPLKTYASELGIRSPTGRRTEEILSACQFDNYFGAVNSTWMLSGSRKAST